MKGVGSPAVRTLPLYMQVAENRGIELHQNLSLMDRSKMRRADQFRATGETSALTQQNQPAPAGSKKPLFLQITQMLKADVSDPVDYADKAITLADRLIDRTVLGRGLNAVTGNLLGDIRTFGKRTYGILFARAEEDYSGFRVAERNSGINAHNLAQLDKDRVLHGAASSFLRMIRPVDAKYSDAIANGRPYTKDDPDDIEYEKRVDVRIDDVAFSELDPEGPKKVVNGLIRAVRSKMPEELRDDPELVAVYASKVALLFHDNLETELNVHDQKHVRKQLLTTIKQINSWMPDGHSVVFSDWLRVLTPEIRKWRQPRPT